MKSLPKGGHRRGAGRPRGKKDCPHTLRQARKREYRELYEQEAVHVLAGLRAGAPVNEAARRRAVRRLVSMQIEFALRRGDTRALHDMIERLVGKVQQPISGDPENPVEIRGKVYVCQFEDGSPVGS